MTPFKFHEVPATQADGHSIVMPVKLESKQALFDFLRGAIPLPNYFGDNWDALYDCLMDLAIGPDSKITLIHDDIPFTGKPSEQQTYLEILAEVTGEPNGLRVIFPERCRSEIERLLSDKK